VSTGRLELYVDGWSRASSTAAATNTSALFGIYRWGWGFSTSQDFNGDVALIACFASSWTIPPSPDNHRISRLAMNNLFGNDS
jgi:hypothetical protein